MNTLKVYLIIGPLGSGKTTLAAELRKSYPHLPVVDTDEVRTSLVERRYSRLQQANDTAVDDRTACHKYNAFKNPLIFGAIGHAVACAPEANRNLVILIDASGWCIGASQAELGVAPEEVVAKVDVLSAPPAVLASRVRRAYVGSELVKAEARAILDAPTVRNAVFYWRRVKRNTATLDVQRWSPAKVAALVAATYSSLIVERETANQPAVSRVAPVDSPIVPVSKEEAANVDHIAAEVVVQATSQPQTLVESLPQSPSAPQDAQQTGAA